MRECGFYGSRPERFPAEQNKFAACPLGQAALARTFSCTREEANARAFARELLQAKIDEEEVKTVSLSDLPKD
jgi:hypothetical protein